MNGRTMVRCPTVLPDESPFDALVEVELIARTGGRAAAPNP